jgi:hypothetical protein
MPRSNFPYGVWDGTTQARPDFSVKRRPDGIDWAQAVEEIRAIQQFLFDGSPPQKVSIDTVLSNGVHTILVDASDGQVQITLPPPITQVGRITIVKVSLDRNHVSIVPNDSELIQGVSGLRLVDQWSTWTLITDLTDWIGV